MAYTQENRLIAIDTPLGADALLLNRFTGREGISRLFNFQLDLLAERAIDTKKIIGQPATVRLQLADGGTRYFNGILSRVAEVGAEARFIHYEAEMVPWLWYLTRTSDCRIFQNLSIPDIIVKIFKDLGFSDFKNLIQGLTEPREYCVQYRETDFNFVSRLMEQYGICYFFEHEEKKHTLLLANTRDAHNPCPAQPRASMEPVAGGVEAEDRVYDWFKTQEFRSAKYTLQDFNFETPTTDLQASADTIVQPAPRKLEIFDYPGEYMTKKEGEAEVKTRMEEEEAFHLTFNASTSCRGFISGHRFELTDANSENGTYLLTEIDHSASVGETYVTRRQTGDKENYRNQIACIPYSVQYRPLRATPKPTVQGSQTAIVVGKSGEEIWTDKYGRIKVQFHWDREGKYDENSSCWIRVAQTWAGKRWGTTFLPRIGQEVIVDFLEGDPDRPLVVGSVYNAEQMPPYDLPGGQNKSTIKSYSSKGGGGFNELRLDDTKGKEQVFIHGEHNLDSRTKKDSLEWVGQDRHLIVVTNQLEKVQGDKHLHVLGDQNEKIDGTWSFEAQDIQEKVGMNHALDGGLELHLNSGLNLVLESGVNLTFKVGSNFININKTGIFIKGTILAFNTGGVPGVGAGVMVQPPQDPKEADKGEPGKMVPTPQAKPPAPITAPSPQAAALRRAAVAGSPFCEKCAAAAYQAAIAAGASEEEARAAADAAGRAGAQAETGGGAPAETPADAGTYWMPPPAAPGDAATPAEGGADEEPAGTAEEKTFIEIELLNDQGEPVAGEKYRVTLPDGTTREGVLDAQGRARVDGIDPGECTVAFIGLHGADLEGA